MTEATKGYDDSPPRNGVIAFYTVLTVVVLLGTTFLLDSYFAKMMDLEVHEKVLTRGLDLAVETKAKEHEALEKAGLANAKRALAQQGRGASPLIAPESGAGKAPVEGWSQLKRTLPAAAAPAAAPETAAPAAPANGAAETAAPAAPSAADVKPQAGGTAPAKGESPVAPANRPAPSPGAPR